MDRIVIVTKGYPSPRHPDRMPFVREIAYAMARQGVRCTVLDPISAHHSLPRTGLPYHSVEQPDDGTEVNVFRPRFVSFGTPKGYSKYGCCNPSALTWRSFAATIRRTMERESLRPQALYGHFLYPSGAAATKVGRVLGIPAFVGVGESELSLVIHDVIGLHAARRDFHECYGFVSNSTVWKELLQQELNLPSTQIGVFPNGVDLTRFRTEDCRTARERLGFPADAFLVACVGAVSHRKGQARVCEAIQGLQGVGGIFAGGGAEELCGGNLLLQRPMPHEKIPELLSAADAFVLPTLAEGCCNALIEAMACGLPIVSSDRHFNDDLLTPDMSIRVDPLNVSQIREAIVTLRDNRKMHSQMAAAATKRASRFDVNDRARRILAFIIDRAGLPL